MALFTRFLVPVDGSDESAAAVALALTLAREVAAKELCFCYVVNDARVYREAAALDAGPGADELIAESQHDGETYVARAKAAAAAAGIPATAIVLEGDPPAAIAKIARDRASDVIVIGTHGHAGIARFVFGSMAEKIMRHAGVPVLMVKR